MGFFLFALLVTSLLVRGESASADVFEAEAFTIELPSDIWDSSPQEMGATILFYSLPDLGPQASLLITVQKTSKHDTIGLLNTTKAAIKKQFPEVSFLLEREVEQDGARWSEIIYAYSGMEFLHLLTVRNEYSYFFTVTTPEELFQKRLPLFRQVFSTWRFR